MDVSNGRELCPDRADDEFVKQNLDQDHPVSRSLLASVSYKKSDQHLHVVSVFDPSTDWLNACDVFALPTHAISAQDPTLSALEDEGDEQSLEALVTTNETAYLHGALSSDKFRIISKGYIR